MSARTASHSVTRPKGARRTKTLFTRMEKMTFWRMILSADREILTAYHLHNHESARQNEHDGQRTPIRPPSVVMPCVILVSVMMLVV